MLHQYLLRSQVINTQKLRWTNARQLGRPPLRRRCRSSRLSVSHLFSSSGTVSRIMCLHTTDRVGTTRTLFQTKLTQFFVGRSNTARLPRPITCDVCFAMATRFRLISSLPFYTPNAAPGRRRENARRTVMEGWKEGCEK